MTVLAPSKTRRAHKLTQEESERFHAMHQQLYGVTFDVPIELVALRAVAIGATPPAIERPPEAEAVSDVSEAIVAPAISTGAGMTRRTTTVTALARAHASRARRSSCSTIRPRCCCRSTGRRSTNTATW